jgi:MFS family permease
MLGGIALFTLASLLGGLAGSPGHLVSMRCLQDLGAALLSPSALALLMGAFDEGPARSLDLAGSLPVTSGLMLPVHALVQASETGWQAPGAVGSPTGLGLAPSVCSAPPWCSSAWSCSPLSARATLSSGT